ncbi:hypothetical protein CV093_11515 [Oceanobacillus sp. 143]|nr:hypothetical protein CV093_11515 [Oceanobacillus sp. 143]
MELTITKEAEDVIKEMNTDNHESILLWYDTIDCGCGVNGLPTFRLIDDIKPIIKRWIMVVFQPTFLNNKPFSLLNQ